LASAYGLTTTDSTNCAYASCKLHYQNAEYGGTEATIKGPEITFTPLASETYGWTKEFVSKCTTANGDEMTSSPYSVVYANACDTDVVVDATALTKDLAYSKTQWSALAALPITNSDATKCVVSCKLKEASQAGIALVQASDKTW